MDLEKYEVTSAINIKDFSTKEVIEDSKKELKKVRKKIFFENLTLAPIEKELINQKLLSSSEKTYLFKYHMNVYSKISKYLNLKERRWLASFI